MSVVRLFQKSRIINKVAGISLIALTACNAVVSQDPARDEVESNKIDLVFAVDATTLRNANRAKVEQSIEEIVAQLEANGKDVRYAVYSAGTAAVNPSTVPVGGGAPAGFDIFSNLFGIFNGNQFQVPGWSSSLPSGQGLPTQVTQGYPQLFPILTQITNMSGSGASSNNIVGSLLPVFSQIFSQQMGGQTNSQMNQQLLMQLVQTATSGRQNGMGQGEIMAALAPQLLSMLQGGGLSSGQGNMASLLLPALLRMYGQSQSNGGNIDQAQIASILAPILLSQIGGGNFGGQNPLQLLGSIFPLMQQFTGMDKQQIQNMAVALAPLAVAYFSGGSGAQYAPLVQAMIPVLFQAMGDGNNQVQVGDATQLLGTPAITSLLGAFAGGGPLAGNFLRSDSALSMVFLGDSMNIGNATEASGLAHTFLQNITKLSGKDLSQINFSNIAMDQSSSCIGKSKQDATSLAAILTQRTNGANTDLCGIQQIIDLLSR